MINPYMINGREYEWADISFIVGGVPVVGIRNIEYGRTREKEAMFAKGRNAHSIQSGNETVTGTMTLTQSQFEALELATGGNILTAHVDIVVSYGIANAGNSVAAAASAVTSTDIIKGAEFTEYTKGMAQNDKFMEIELPFIALDIINA